MVLSNSMDLERLSEEWSVALTKHDLDTALDVATRGYFAALTGGDHVQVMMFLGFVRHAADSLFEAKVMHKAPNDDKANPCSFCLREKTRMVRGVGVAICYDCLDSIRTGDSRIP